MRRKRIIKRKYPIKRVSKRNYDDPIYKKWRKLVKLRDKHCCRWPGCKQKKKLNIHHIMKWSSYPSLRYEVGNGITLCRKHHDSIKGREDDLIRFFLDILNRDLK